MNPAAPDNRFDRDTSVSMLARDLYEARIDGGWWIHAGPNGGYLAALLLRTMRLAVDDPKREPRSLTVHFTARAKEGPARVMTCIERSGRTLSTVTARLWQDDRLIAFAVAALATTRDGGQIFQDGSMPEAPPPEGIERRMGPAGGSPFRERWDLRPVFGGVEGQHHEALSGGWIRPAEPRAGDALLIAALTDSWPPAIFSKQAPDEIARGVPTIELTVHFRAPDAARTPADAFFLVALRSGSARDGFMEEDGEIWSRDGVLLAQSRQLALLA